MRRLWLIGLLAIAGAVWIVAAPAAGPSRPPTHIARHHLLGRTFGHHARPAPHAGLLFPTQPEGREKLFPGEPSVGPAAPDLAMLHLLASEFGLATAGHMGGPLSHILLPPPIHVEHEGTPLPQPVTPAEAGAGNAATAQPNAARPSSPRPLGVGGPGRPISGWRGPGMPGPGRSTRTSSF